MTNERSSKMVTSVDYKYVVISPVWEFRYT